MPPKKAVNDARKERVSKPVASTAASGKRKAASSTAEETTNFKRIKTDTSTTKPKANTGIKKAPASGASKATPKATAAKGATAKETKPPKPNTAAKASSKRKHGDVADNAAAESQPAKKTKAPSKPQKALPVINQAPTDRLDVFVFGEGSGGELGLGTEKKAMDVKRPRINHLLSADKVGVVQIATGGMHVLALTHNNVILSWGVNDQGACGRDTNWDGGLKDMDTGEDSDEESETNGLNPKEATPTAIDMNVFPAGTVITQVAAGDSCSFALTADGSVYGWGTFRANEGVLGFNADVEVQRTPVLMKELKKIKHIACGSNHVLALDADGNVFAWGSGQQNQLGRRVVERTRAAGLTPREFGLPRKQIQHVSCGAYHSFAIDKKGNVWSWGLNSFGQCGIRKGAGEDEAIVAVPTKVDSLTDRKMQMLKGGSQHSVGVAGNGDCLVWGRADGAQLGIDVGKVPKSDVIYDERERPRIVISPTAVPGTAPCTFVTAESSHSIAILANGHAHSWGFSATYQTGQGTDDDISIATRIENTAVRERHLVWAGAGGQYSMLAAVAGK